MTTTETIPAVETVTLPASFTAPRKALLAALKSLAAVIPSRCPFPEFKCVNLGINGTVDLSATDMEITSRLVDTAWERTGDAIARFAPGRAIACLTGSKAPDATLTIDRTAGALLVSCGASSVSIPLDVEQPTEHLPMPAAGELLFSIDASELRRAVELTEYATDCGTSPYRYALEGIQIEPGGLYEPGDTGRVTFCATDSRRLAVYHAACEVSAESFGINYIDGSEQAGVVLPAKFWACLVKALPKAGTVEIRRDSELVPQKDEHGEILPGKFETITRYSATCGGVRVETLPVEGRFPQYRGVIPATTEFTLTVRADELLEAVKAAKTGIARGCDAVEFTVPTSENSLNVAGRSLESAAMALCPIMDRGGIQPGQPFRILLDAAHIIDACKPHKREYVLLEFGPDDESPVTIRRGDFFCLTMPHIYTHPDYSCYRQP